MNKETKEQYGFKVLTPRTGYKITQATLESEQERMFYDTVAMAMDGDEQQYTEWSTAKVNKWKKQYEDEENNEE